MIIPRILKSISNPNMNTSLFNHALSLPFGFAPTAMQMISHPSGELIPAKVAYESKLIYCLSMISTKSLKEIKEVNRTGMRFLQMYISKDWELTEASVKLAEKYGFAGLVITVDAQVLGVRRRERKQPFNVEHLTCPVLEEMKELCPNLSSSHVHRGSWQANRDFSLNWKTIERIRATTKLKIVLKGIMHPKDAALAVDYCDAIWISNHGGRQLDTLPATIDVLPSIKLVVGNKIPIFIDGGIRTGNDLFKCLALGADYVFIGRSVQYSLALGEEGVRKMVAILEDELRRCMVLVGCHSLREIQAESIVPEPSL